MSATRRFVTVAARSKYSRFECDHCHKRIGYEGTVRELHEDDGVVLPWSAICSECATAGKRL